MKKKLLFTVLLASFLAFPQASLVKDIYPGAGGGIHVSGFESAVINNRLIFPASNTITNIFDVWISDGTESGTNVLHQLVPSGNGFTQDFYYSNVLNKVIFMGNIGAPNTFSVLTTDGTPSGLQSLSGGNYAFLVSPLNPDNPQDFTDFNGNVFFNLNQTSSSSKYELFSTDGTPSGTGLFKELRSGSLGGNPYNFKEYNNKLFFVANDGNTGYELWSSDGTNSGTTLFLDIYSGASNLTSLPEELTVFNNKLYFSANNGTNGRELWVTDGTLGGTQMVLDLYSGTIGSFPSNLTVCNNALYFTATHPTLGREIFKMTPSETITNLKNINVGNASSSPFNLFAFNNELYFAADDGNGVELWKSGGFNSNTNKLIDINPSGESNPGNFKEYNGKLYFVADDGIHGRELWVTDGTAINTSMAADIYPGSSSSDPKSLVVVNNFLLFAAQNGVNGIELWRYQDPTLSSNEFELDKSSIKLYPNPAKSYFELSTTENIEKVDVFSLQGQLVKSFSTQNQYSTLEFQNGIYLVKIYTDKGVVNQMLVKKD